MKKEAMKNLIRLKAEAGSFNPYACMELKCMENMLNSMCDAGPAMLKDLSRVFNAGGKRLRPILALLCSKLEGGGNKDVVPLMYMLELMHTASLVHDDIVDNAKLRRGCPTINSTSGNAAAAQSGDYLLAKAMEQLGIYRGTGINEELAEVSSQMCLGELEQLRIRFKTREQTRGLYFLQIERKTAGLIAASCYTGALAAGMKKPQALILRAYGAFLGIAFQLRDDLSDFDEMGVTGKMPGQDLKNGIFTLPVIRLIEEGLPAHIIRLLEDKQKSKQEIQYLVDYIRSTNVSVDVEILIRNIIDEAVTALSGFPDCPEKTALTELANALIERPLLRSVSDVC